MFPLYFRWTFNSTSYTPAERDAPIFFPFLNYHAVIDPAGRWKLVSDYGEPWELYSLHTDHAELNDLASVRPAKRNALAKKWDV